MSLVLPKRLSLPDRLRNSRRQEADAARATGGRVTPGSGNGAEKGDVRVRGTLRVECKSTIAASYSLKLEDLRTVERIAVAAGEVPAFQIRFVDAAGNPLFEAVVLPGWAASELMTVNPSDDGPMVISLRGEVR